MKTPRPRLPMPKVPVKVPGMRAVTGVFAGTFAGTFAEPRWDKARDTLHTQIRAAMKSGRSYGKTITPTLREMEKLLPRVSGVVYEDAVVSELCSMVIAEDLQCGIQEFCVAAPELDCMKDARILEYHAATSHLISSAAALIGARFDDNSPPPAIDTAMAFDAVFIKLGTAPHEDTRSRFYTRMSPRDIMDALSHFEYRPC